MFSRQLTDLLCDGVAAIDVHALERAVHRPPEEFVNRLWEQWGGLARMARWVIAPQDWQAIAQWDARDVDQLLDALIDRGDHGLVLWNHPQWYQSALAGLRRRLLAQRGQL